MKGRPVPGGARCSGNPPTAPPQGEKSTASPDEAGQSCTYDGGRDTGGKQLSSEREFDAHVKAEIRTNAALINAAGIK
jgi:hypothetical protein